MDIDTLNWLRSPAGMALLAELATADLRETQLLPTLSRLRAQYPPALARAAVEQVLLRRRAQAKFPAAAQLFFTREALEQASTAVVAAYRATRFAPYADVADLCCGIGADALALAAAGMHVSAVDRDPLRLAIAAANAQALGLAERITLHHADLLTTAPPAAEALFCDPGRRAGGRRRFHVEQYEPPLHHILGWQALTPALAVKLAPGVEIAELDAAGNAELEFVSLDGELKEATLWCGPLASTLRRATVLRSAQDTADQTTGPSTIPPYRAYTLSIASPRPIIPCSAPAAFLYEPDPALIRAGLVAELASQLGAAQLDPQIAYLTSDTLVTTPFARLWRVLEWLPFSLKRLRVRLREHDAGTVTVKKRGSPLDTDALARQLSGSGAQPLVVVLTQLNAQPVALLCAGM